MTLPTSGPISLLNVQGEFGGSNPIAISEYYGAGGAPAGPRIALSDFYGLSNYTGSRFVYRGIQQASATSGGTLSTWTLPSSTGGSLFLSMMAIVSPTTAYADFGPNKTNFSPISGISAVKFVGTSPWRIIWYIKGGMSATSAGGQTASTDWTGVFPFRVYVATWEVFDSVWPNNFPFNYNASTGPISGTLKWNGNTSIGSTGYCGMVHTNTAITSITGPNVTVDQLNVDNNDAGFISCYSGIITNPTEGLIPITASPSTAETAFSLNSSYGYGPDPR